MYERNTIPLPPGDACVVFADDLEKILALPVKTGQLSPQTVVQPANKELQSPLAAICRRLLLPGSCLMGWKNVEQLATLAQRGHGCLLCLSHSSNLDVPTLYALLEDWETVDTFQQIMWIAGRKLSEDTALTRLLIQSCHRIVITPPSWFELPHSVDEVKQARLLNRAAQRQMLKLRHEGWIFGLFPSGTRRRLDDESTTHALPQSDSYIKSFDYMVLGRIDGCTLPVSCDRDFTHETPRCDRVIYTFGSVQESKRWRQKALERFPTLGQKAATARALDEFIKDL